MMMMMMMREGSLGSQCNVILSINAVPCPIIRKSTRLLLLAIQTATYIHTYLLWSEFFFLLSSSKWQFLHKSRTGVLASSPPVLIQDFSKHPMRQGIPWRSHVSSIHSFIHSSIIFIHSGVWPFLFCMD